MKKYKLIINIILFVVLLSSLIAFALMINPCNIFFDNYSIYRDWVKIESSTGLEQELSITLSRFLQTLFAVIFSALSTITSAVFLFMFNLKKPLVDKFQAKLAARNQKRAAAKAERAEADRQAKIAELEKQLEELKKD